MQISAKDLGWLKTDDFCPRCFWITRHDRKLPYQTPFAGIFSSIDSYTKSVVAKYFEKHGRLPDWLGGIGDVKRLVKVNASNFRTEKDGTILTGIPDELFERPDGSYGIIGYAAAKAVQESIYDACMQAETIPYDLAFQKMIPSCSDLP